MAPLRVVTWNLMHGRSLPGAGRDLFEDFADALAGWDWEVALLQEVPPWWPAQLGARLGASARTVLTSRNALLGARRAVAQRWPDVIKSNGGGCNAILVRGPAIVAHRRQRLAWRPERRWLHAVALRTPRVWIGNLHATVHHERRALAEGEQAGRRLLAWAGGDPALLGGDFNVRTSSLPGWTHAGGHDVDQLFACGLEVLGGAQVLERGNLSDHSPVLWEIAQPIGSDISQRARYGRPARSPKPRSIRSAFSLRDPRPGSTPSWTAAS